MEATRDQWAGRQCGLGVSADQGGRSLARRVLSGSGAYVLGPVMHEVTPALEQVAAPVGGLDAVAVDVG